MTNKVVYNKVPLMVIPAHCVQLQAPVKTDV